MVGLLGHRKVVLAVADRRGLGFAALVELLARVITNGFEHAVASPVVALFQHHQRLLDQRADEVEHVVAGQRVRATDLLGGRHVEAADEDAEPAEEGLLRLGQQLVRPVDKRTKRLLPFLEHAGAAGEDLVAVLEPGVDIGHRQRTHPRRRQFERQRDALEAHHQFRHRGCFALVQREGRLVRLGALDEQTNRGRPRQGLDPVATRRQRQWQHGVALLAG